MHFGHFATPSTTPRIVHCMNVVFIFLSKSQQKSKECLYQSSSVWIRVCSAWLYVWLLQFAHPWGGWRSSESTGPGPCCKSRCGGRGCGHCCSPGRYHPAHRAASLLPPWRGKLASVTWDCGPTTGPEEEEVVKADGGERKNGENDAMQMMMRRRWDVVWRGRERETQGGKGRRMNKKINI